MKAIFLDIDGVIATPTSVRLNYLLGRDPARQRYDLVSLTYLGRLVAKTGALVVLASNWRCDGQGIASNFVQAVMDNLYAQLAAAGAPVSGTTPQLPDGDRSDEIAAWLDAHPCDAYAIIDDLACFEARRDVCAGHLVRIEDSGGIRYPHFWRALDLLQDPLEQEAAVAP